MLIATLVVTLLLFGVHTAPHNKSRLKTEDITHQKLKLTDISYKYFNSLEAKATPLYYCSSAISSNILYRLPKALKCEFLKLDKVNKIVPITIWSDTPGIQSTTAYHCKASSTYAMRYRNFFASDQEKTEISDKYVSEAACKDMIKTKISPDGDPMKQIATRLWRTDNKVTIDYSWPLYREETIINYQLTLITVTRSNADDILVTTIPTMESCPFQDGVCRAQDKSVILWELDLETTCRLTKGLSTLCMYSEGDDQLTCPQLTLAMTKTETLEICGLTIFTSQQGVLYTTDKDGDISNVTATTAMIDRLTRVKIHPVRKREIPKFEESEDQIEEDESTVTQPTTATPEIKQAARPVTIPKFVDIDDQEEIPNTKSESVLPTPQPTEKLSEEIITSPPFVPPKDYDDDEWQHPFLRLNETTPTTSVPKPFPTPKPSILISQIPKKSPVIPIPVFEGDDDISEEPLENQPITMRPIQTPPNNQPGLTHLPMIKHKMPLGRITFEEFMELYPPATKGTYIGQGQINIDEETSETPRKTMTVEVRQHEEKTQETFQKTRYLGTQTDVVYALNPNKSRHDVTIFTAPEVNARLQYLYTILQHNLTSALQEVHHSTCINQKSILDLLISMAEQRQANFITRVLLPNERYLVQNQGDALELKQCLEVNSYHFLPRSTTNCTRNIPVSFVINHLKYDGYMNEMSHQIVDEPELINCEEQRPFYFSTLDDGMILLTNTTTNFDLPYLPTADNFDKKITPFTDQIFKSQGMFTRRQLTSQDTMLSLIQGFQSPVTMDNVMRTKRSGHTWNPAQESIAESLTNMTLSPIKRLFWQIGGLILMLILLRILIALLWKCKGSIGTCCCFLPKVCYKLTCNCCKKIKSRKPKTDGRSIPPPDYSMTMATYDETVRSPGPSRQTTVLVAETNETTKNRSIYPKLRPSAPRYEESEISDEEIAEPREQLQTFGTRILQNRITRP